jgi:hypothetical protein
MRSTILLRLSIVAALSSSSLPAQAQEPRETARNPFLTVLHVDSEVVGAGGYVEVEETTVSIDGEAWDYGGRVFALFTRHQGQGPWLVVATSAAKPGGLFEFSGVGFPGPGDYDVVVGMLAPGSVETSTTIEDRHLVDKGVLSRRVQVRITGVPQRGAELTPLVEQVTPALVSFGPVALTPTKTAVVQPGGDVVISAPRLPGMGVYVVTQVPNTQRCFVDGPAAPGAAPGEWVRPVLLSVPGDPRQLRWQMRAVAIRAPFPEGETDCRRLWKLDALISPVVQLITEDSPDGSGDYRVPYVTIKQIGPHVVGDQSASGRAITLNQGAVLKASLARLPEGAQAAAVTRCSTSSTMRSHGPGIPEGQPLPDENPLGPKTTMIWSLEFSTPPTEENCTEFDVRVAVFAGPAPTDWFNVSGLNGKSVLSISTPVKVKVKEAKDAKTEIAVSRVGQTEVDTDPENEIEVGPSESVEVTTKGLRPYQRTAVCWSRQPGSTWRCAGMIPNGEKHLVPSVDFTGSGFAPGVPYVLMAIVTTSPPPAGLLTDEEFRQHIAIPSQPVLIRTREGLLGRLTRSFSRNGDGGSASGGTSDSAKARADGVPRAAGFNVPIWTPLVVLLMAALALGLLERKHGTVSPVFQGAADSLKRSYDSARNWFVFPEKINPGDLIAGLALLALAIFLIAAYYLKTYTEAVQILTHLPKTKSTGLAIWFITAMALVGIFVHFCSIFEKRNGYSGGLYMARLVLMFIGFILALLNAGLYFETFRRTAGGIAPPLAAMGFFAIAAVEAAWFFWITQLIYSNMGALAQRVAPLPVLAASGACRVIQRTLEMIPKDRSKEQEGHKAQNKDEHGDDADAGKGGNQ